MSYRQQLRRHRQQLRRDQGLELLNTKVRDAMVVAFVEANRSGGVAPEASTPVIPPDSGVS